MPTVAQKTVMQTKLWEKKISSDDNSKLNENWDGSDSF